MTTLYFKKTNPDYKGRTLKGSNLSVAIAIVFGIVSTYLIHWVAGIVTGMILYYIMQFYMLWSNQEYITQIAFDENRILISYDNQGNGKTVEGSPNEFVFSIKEGKGRFGQLSLGVYQNNVEVIRQYITGDWTVEKMKEIVTLFEYGNRSFK